VNFFWFILEVSENFVTISAVLLYFDT